MSLLHTLQIFELFEDRQIKGQDCVNLFVKYPTVIASTHSVVSFKGNTDFLRIVIPGLKGKLVGGKAPTLGIVGRPGGIGTRSTSVGSVFDIDGTIAALACALKLADMQLKDIKLDGDVIVTTHVCPNSPALPDKEIDYRELLVDVNTMYEHEIARTADAILSIDSIKGSRIIHHKGYAISPTVKQGYILPVAEKLLKMMEMTSGRQAVTFPVTTQDITPCGNGVSHLNSILQPAIATDAPVVAIAICTELGVSDQGIGDSHEVDIASVVKFVVEVSKQFGRDGMGLFFDLGELALLQSLYGSMSHLQMRR